MKLLMILTALFIQNSQAATFKDNREGGGAEGMTNAGILFDEMKNDGFTTILRPDGYEEVTVINLVCLKDKRKEFRCEADDPKTGKRTKMRWFHFASFLADGIVTRVDNPLNFDDKKWDIRASKLICEHFSKWSQSEKNRCFVNMSFE